MTQYSRKSSPGTQVLGALLVIIGLGALIAKLWITELRDIALHSGVQIWGPLLFIAAGVIWWIADVQQRSDRGQSKCARSSWEARHDN